MTSKLLVSSKVLRNNIQQLISLKNHQIFCPIVKSNAYGHGLECVWQILKDENITWLGVHSIQEAQRLRKVGYDGKIIILGYVTNAELAEVAALQASICVSSLQQLQGIAASGNPLQLHIKLECGTNRQGVPENQLESLVALLLDRDNLKVEGIYSHFANIEDTTNHDFAKAQMKRFHEIVALYYQLVEGKQHLIPQYQHMTCSAAYLLFTETHHDLCRVGISCYGYWPSSATKISWRERHDKILQLQPALTWKTQVGQIKHLQPGETVGYGCSYYVNSAMTIAVLPVGYYDGYCRSMREAYVLIRGKRAPLVGRICMNIMMVDISHIPNVSLEDEVVLLGKQGEEEITAEHLGDWSGTIHYEALTRISPDIPRYVVD